MDPLKSQQSLSHISIHSNSLASKGKDLLASSPDEMVVSQKVKDFVAHSKNIAVLFDRKPSARAQSIMSPLERLACFIGGGALLAISALGIVAIVGGIVAAGVSFRPCSCQY